MSNLHDELNKFLLSKNYVSPWLFSDQPYNALLASAASITTVKKHSFLFMQGSENNNLYIVRTGRLRIFFSDNTGTEKCIFITEKGGMLGAVCAFNPNICNVSAYAITDATLFTINVQDLLRVLNLHPSISVDIFNDLAYKVRCLCSNMEYSSKKSIVRVAAALLALCVRYGKLQDDGSIFIAIRFTHKELSELVNLNRVTVSKIYGEFVHLNIIRKKDAHLIIYDVEKLKLYLD